MLIGIMTNNCNAAQILERCFWAQFAFVTLRFQDWETRADWRRAFDIIRDTDDVIVADVADEADVDLVHELGGMVLRLDR